MDRLQQRLVGSVVEVHTRIVLQIRFGDHHLLATLQIHHQREDLQPLVVDLRDRLVHIGRLEGVEELLLDGRSLAVHEVGEGLVVLGEAENSLLIRNANGVLHPRGETIGHTLIIGTEHQAVVSFEVEAQLVVVILHLTLLVERRRDCLIHRLPLHVRHLGIRSQHLPVCQGEGECGVHHLLATLREGEMDLLIHRHLHPHLLVGRLQLKTLLGHQGPSAQAAQGDRKNTCSFHDNVFVTYFFYLISYFGDISKQIDPNGGESRWFKRVHMPLGSNIERYQGLFANVLSLDCLR